MILAAVRLEARLVVARRPKRDVEGTDRRGDRSRDRRVEAKSRVESRRGEKRLNRQRLRHSVGYR